MDHANGVDVSWMAHGTPKKGSAKKTNRNSNHTRQSSASSTPRDIATPPRPIPSSNGHGPALLSSSPSTPKLDSPSRPSFMRGGSVDKTASSQTPPSTQRRSSWFQTFSSKFSSSSSALSTSLSATPPSTTLSTPHTEPPGPADIPPIPRITPSKNAVLQHAAKIEGNGPYTPAPPKHPASFLGVLRRLSSTNTSPGPSKGTHGLVDRVILNVDDHRERCQIQELHQAKLRRVAFCVDVEIAPMPSYDNPPAAKTVETPRNSGTDDNSSPKAVQAADTTTTTTTTPTTTTTTTTTTGVVGLGIGQGGSARVVDGKPDQGAVADMRGSSSPTMTMSQKESTSKKKEKKKKQEEERKARNAKKRQEAEANGSMPMELHRSSSSESSSSVSATANPNPNTNTNGPSRSHAFPTTNPVRIYRRCCQLRESHILKKVTEKLGDPSNSLEPGVLEKLDLSGYYLDLPDLVTIGDFLAVVPVKEVILESCGMTDEGLRVVLAGLLAAKQRTGPRRRRVSTTDGLTPQGGVVERLVVKNNRIGPEGWRHIALFTYMCRSLKHLDLSGLRFPRPLYRPETPLHTPEDAHNAPVDYSFLFSKAIGERFAGSELELLNLGDTDINSDQLGVLMDGVIRCGIRRLGLANNNLDGEGLEHVARYLRDGKCEGLDLCGNDLRERLDVIGSSLTEGHPLCALSLADCGLNAAALCKLFPRLVRLSNAKFIDLSHNRELFNCEPSAVGVLRRYLPKMLCLKRIHLADVAMTPEQAIQIFEILPEVSHLAHISLLENHRIESLAHSRSPESREEACALYTSLLAATRVSDTIICVDIDFPGESAGEVVKGLAKRMLGYCLRNLGRMQVPELGSSMTPELESELLQPTPPPEKSPDVLVDLVEDDGDASDVGEVEVDDDYVIGGTGVIKALDVCLKHRGGESRRQSGEFIHEVETGSIVPRPTLPPGKAKDMSKHLLQKARKIRIRMKPALEKAKGDKGDQNAYQRLLFLDQTLDAMIKRFEDQFPETKLLEGQAALLAKAGLPVVEISEVPSPTPDESGIFSDDEETNVRPRSRAGSTLSYTSKALAEEEGRVLRAGHKFRRGLLKQEHYEMLGTLEELGADPKHLRMLNEMVEELDDSFLKAKVEEMGVVETFKMEKEMVFRLVKERDPAHWERFVESQEKAAKNVAPGNPSSTPGIGGFIGLEGKIAEDPVAEGLD